MHLLLGLGFKVTSVSPQNTIRKFEAYVAQCHSLEQLNTWADFVSDYIRMRDNRKEPAVFILVWQEKTKPSPRKGVTLHALDDYIGEYDRLVFAMLASSNIKCETYLKDYLAELTSSVIDDNAEMLAACISQYMDFMKSPYETVQQCATGMPGGYLFRKSRSEVEQDVWKAQIRAIYPVIEMYRENFVKQHYSSIKAQLPLSAPYGEVYENPNDVELGTLVYLANRFSLSSDEYNCLVAFKNALTLEEIQDLYK